MTGLNLSGGEGLSRAFEPYLKNKGKMLRRGGQRCFVTGVEQIMLIMPVSARYVGSG
jgi:hypothetical protein